MKNLTSVTEAEPPKDQTFLGLFNGHPWLAVAVWNPSDETYTYATLAASMYHGKDDFYFENEYSRESNSLIAWMPMPGVSKDLPGEMKQYEYRRAQL